MSLDKINDTSLIGIEGHIKYDPNWRNIGA